LKHDLSIAHSVTPSSESSLVVVLSAAMWSMGAQVHFKKIIANFCGLNWQLWRHKHWNMMSSQIHHTNTKV